MDIVRNTGERTRWKTGPAGQTPLRILLKCCLRYVTCRFLRTQLKQSAFTYMNISCIILNTVVESRLYA